MSIKGYYLYRADLIKAPIKFMIKNYFFPILSAISTNIKKIIVLNSQTICIVKTLLL